MTSSQQRGLAAAIVGLMSFVSSGCRSTSNSAVAVAPALGQSGIIGQRLTIRPERRNVTQTIELDGVLERYPLATLTASQAGHFTPLGSAVGGGPVRNGDQIGRIIDCVSEPAGDQGGCAESGARVLATIDGFVEPLGEVVVSRGDVLGQITHPGFRAKLPVQRALDVPALARPTGVRLRIGTDGPVVDGTFESLSYNIESSASTLWVAVSGNDYVEGSGLRAVVQIAAASNVLTLPRSAVSVAGKTVRFVELDAAGATQIKEALLIVADAAFVGAVLPESISVLEFPLASELAG